MGLLSVSEKKMGLAFDSGTINPSPKQNYQEPVTWHVVRSVHPMAPLPVQENRNPKLNS
jgi:hypothetical protein